MGAPALVGSGSAAMTRPAGPFASPPPKKAPKVKREPNRCAFCYVPIGPKATTCIRHHWITKRRFGKCGNCGEVFAVPPSTLSRGGGKFCSAKCYFARQATRPGFIDVKCANCGQAFRRTQGAVKRVKQSFCSKRCSHEYISGERHHSYRGGERHRRGPGWQANRRACRERDRNCRACGKTPEQNGQALSVDHVIPWRLFADERIANSLENLIALCRSCHARKWRAETAYIRGDVLGWLAYLRNVGVDPASLDGLYAYLRPVGEGSAA